VNSPFLYDIGMLSLAAAAITVVFVVPFRLAWRRRKSLEQP
jgi:hypothetical protein